MQCSFTFFDTTVLLELGAAIALVIIQTKFRLQVPFTLINGGNNKLQKLVINCELPYFI